MNKKLYIGNLSYDANEEDIKQLFGTYGGVVDVKIITDRFTGRPRGFAFVEMESDEAADKAKQGLHGQDFKGRALAIDFAKTERRDDRGGGGGGGGGGGRGGERRGPRREERNEW